VSEGSHDAVAEAIRQHGGRVLPFRVNPDGVTVVGRNRRPAREGNPLR